MKIGYARVSTDEQILDRQIDALNRVGCERIFEEKMTGTKKERPALTELLAFARSGDCLVVESLSRLGRNTKNLIELVEDIQKRGVQLISLKESIDTTTATGKFMFTMLSALSQMERDLISERTQEGLKAARARGHKGGRPSVKSDKINMALKMYDAKTIPVPEIIKTTGVSKATIYRYVNKKMVGGEG